MMMIGGAMYLTRFADSMLQERLNSAGAVLIRGPKGCGKTETAMQKAKSIARMDIDESVRIRMEIDPKLVLQGDVPRLIDEWQEYPIIWNHVRHEVDTRKQKGQFILTGSSSVRDQARLHSGAGRFSVLTMRPMSLFERGWSTGEVSLESLVTGVIPKSDEVPFSLHDLAGKIALGGWPGLIGTNTEDGLRAVRDYISLIAEVDINKVSGSNREPQKVRRLLQSFARNISTEAALVTLVKDTNGTDGFVSTETANTYIDALERLMVVEHLPAWNTHIRSSDTLRKSPKRHFTDPSLAIGALGLSIDKLLADLEYFELLFESMVIRDLRIYAEVHEAMVFHYRDSTNFEVDAILEYPDGRWAAFEIKLGFGAQDAAAANLLKLAQKVDQKRMGTPVALTVITANGFAFRRKDGVNVVPIGVLTA
jgi:hypothetical protein